MKLKKLFLKFCSPCYRVDPTTALQFVESCLNIPQLWQGRDTKSSRGIETSFYTDRTEEDILCLSSEQLSCLVMYVLMEAERDLRRYEGNSGVHAAIELITRDSILCTLLAFLSRELNTQWALSEGLLSY